FARGLVDTLPAGLREAVYSVEEAPAVVFALLVAAGAGAELAGTQRDAVVAFGGDGVAARVESLVPLVRSAGPRVRLPLLDMALPALRRLTPERAAALLRSVHALILADGSIKPLEFAVYRTLRSEERRVGKLSCCWRDE